MQLDCVWEPEKAYVCFIQNKHASLPQEFQLQQLCVSDYHLHVGAQEGNKIFCASPPKAPSAGMRQVINKQTSKYIIANC